MDAYSPPFTVRYAEIQIKALDFEFHGGLIRTKILGANLSIIRLNSGNFGVFYPTEPKLKIAQFVKLLKSSKLIQKL